MDQLEPVLAFSCSLSVQASFYISLGLTSPIWEMKKSDQVNSAPPSFKNTFTCLCSVWPNFVTEQGPAQLSGPKHILAH